MTKRYVKVEYMAGEFVGPDNQETRLSYQGWRESSRFHGHRFKRRVALH